MIELYMLAKLKTLKNAGKTIIFLPKIFSKYGKDWTIDWIEIEPSNLNRAEAFAYRTFKPEFNKKNPSELLGNDS